MTIHEGASCLSMPVRSPQKTDEQLPAFAPAEGAEPVALTQVERVHHDWVVKRYLAEDLSLLEVFNEDGVQRLEDIDLEMEDRIYECYSYRTADFSSVMGEVKAKRGFRRDDWDVHTTTRTVLRSDATHFHLHAELDVIIGFLEHRPHLGFPLLAHRVEAGFLVESVKDGVARFTRF